MTFFQWRRFNFFDFKKDVGDSEGSLSENLCDVSATCVTSGRGHLIIGTQQGNLILVDRSFSVHTFKAFSESVRKVVQLRQSGILVTIGEDGGDEAYLKVYNMDKPDKTSGHSGSLLRISRLTNGNSSNSVKGKDVTALAVHENQSLMAIGLKDGTLLLYRGDVSRERGSKCKVIYKGGEAPITGCAFRISSKASYLYVATEIEVVSINITVRDKEITTCLDKLGCYEGLAIQADLVLDTHFIMGRKDAVYCYNPESRGQCYAFEGDKKHIYWFRNYLVVVSTNDGNTNDMVTLTIFDVQNKFIAFTAPVKPIKALFSEWGALFALTENDNKLIQLTEKDTQSKLDILFKKNFYDIAIKIAKNQSYVDSDGLVDIFRQYGDHLYSKGDHDGAIENYVKTIGHLEPSYVIRRFLDAHRIHHLTAYLQGLHREGLANEDHTTLLLNCYTKLKDNKKLDEFIMTKDREVDFDVEIAIKVCRQANYFQHALALAKKHHHHEWYLKIQLEDHKDYKDALDYISDLEFESAELSLKQYGNVLMKNLPNETTELLIALCTDYKRKSKDLITENMLANIQDQKKFSSPENFLHLFINKSSNMIEFLEEIIKRSSYVHENDANYMVYNTLLEHYLSTFHLDVENEKKIMDILRSEGQKYDPDQALVLCQSHNFHAGVLYLYERKGLYGQILKHHVSLGNLEGALKTCRTFGPQDPHLWVLALNNFALDASATQAHISEILEKIERMKLMSPLMVVSSLSSSPLASLGTLREYLIRFLDAEDRLVEDDLKLIQQYKADTALIRDDIKGLRTKVSVFQGSKCSACSHELELPATHFLCQHSYHQHCLQSYSESESECPTCVVENKKILEVIKSQESNRDSHDAFHYQLDKAEDGFSVVAEYFGRGMFRENKSIDISSIPEPPPVKPEIPLSERLIDVPQSHSSPRVVSEARLRADVAPTSKPIVSDARLRLNEGNAHSRIDSNLSRQPSSSLTRMAPHRSSTRSVAGAAAATTSAVDIDEIKPKDHSTVPPKEYNPFDDSPTGSNDSKNPFKNDNENKNPFASSSESKNPFGDDADDEYDEKLNPFA